MNEPRNSGAFRSLRFAGGVAVAGLAVAVFLGVGSYFFWQTEKKNDVQSQRGLQDLRARLDTLKRERDDLRGSEDTYKMLRAQGVFSPEQRIDLIEAMTALKRRHRLLGLDYDISPQRPLKFGAGGNYAAAEVRASRLHLKIKAYHDADLVAFLDEFPRIQRGFFPIDQCAVKRKASEAQESRPLAVTSAVAAFVDNVKPPPPVAADATATIEAECSLEWITLVDRGTLPLAAPVSPLPARKPI